MAGIKIIPLTERQRLQLEEGFRQGKSHAHRMRCRAVLLKSTGLTLGRSFSPDRNEAINFYRTAIKVSIQAVSQVPELVYPSARRHHAVKIILKNSRIYFFYSGEEKTESRACFVKTVGDFVKTVGDFPKTVGDFFKTVGDFFLKAGRKNLQPSETIKKPDILRRNFLPFSFL